MILRADPGSITTVPWAIDPTAQVIHDCYFADGTWSISRRVRCCGACCELYADRGWKPVVGPELEFYLTEKNIDPDLPLKAPVGRSGRAETSRQVYSIDAVNEFDPLFEDIYDYCALMNLDVDTLIHETGAGQMGLNFQHGDRWPWPTTCSTSSAPCARRRSSTTCTPPSWPSRWRASRVPRCMCTRA
jgi:glutamine synthetase